jgi:hypothetical protein
MARGRVGIQAAGMSVMTPAAMCDRAGPEREAARDPAHAAYGHAAAILASAQALEAATHPAGSAAATPATLACLETSLDALSLAVARLRVHALDRLADPVLPTDQAGRQRARVATDLAQLAGTLEQAASASARARRSIAPAAGELGGA